MPCVVVFYRWNDRLYKFQENKKVPEFLTKENVQQLENLQNKAEVTFNGLLNSICG